jgi:hypothetical protein
METGFSHLPVGNLNFGCVNRNEAGLNVFWLRDATLEESDNLPDPDVLAQEIVEDLETVPRTMPRNHAKSGHECYHQRAVVSCKMVYQS